MNAAALDDQVNLWRSYVARHVAISRDDIDELESHLRMRIDALREKGLDDDEAFLVAVKRLGALDEVSREFAREHSERLWKQLVIGADEPDLARRAVLGRGWWAILVAALAAVVARVLVVVVPPADPGLMLRTGALTVAGALTCYFLVRRRAQPATVLVTALGLAGCVAVSVGFPFAVDGSTTVIAALHIPVVAWILMGLAYVAQSDGGAGWRSSRARMDLIRFTGEWVVYLALIALGGGVLTGLTAAVLAALGLDPVTLLAEWVVPMGAAGATVVAAWLVEEKKSVIENIAPVLTLVFTPLFTVLLVTTLIALLVQLPTGLADRGLLIVIDAILLVTLGLVLYTFSARDPQAPSRWFDRLQLIMLVVALVVDAIVLVATLVRVGDPYGLTPNRVAALGVNLVLLVNLAGTSWLLFGFLRRRRTFAAVERWQTGYVPVYLGWAIVAVVVLPLVYGFA